MEKFSSEQLSAQETNREFAECDMALDKLDRAIEFETNQLVAGAEELEKIIEQNMDALNNFWGRWTSVQQGPRSVLELSFMEPSKTAEM